MEKSDLREIPKFGNLSQKTQTEFEKQKVRLLKALESERCIDPRCRSCDNCGFPISSSNYVRAFKEYTPEGTPFFYWSCSRQCGDKIMNEIETGKRFRAPLLPFQ